MEKKSQDTTSKPVGAFVSADEDDHLENNRETRRFPRRYRVDED